MFRLLFPQLEIWLPNLREKLRLSGKQRFMILLLFFNLLLLAILVLSVRNLEIVERISTVQVEITRVVERLQTVQALQQQLVYVTETPTPQQVVFVTVTPTPTRTTVPSPTRQIVSTSTATATRTQPTATRAPTQATTPVPTTRTRTPAPTATGTPTRVLSPTPTVTSVPTATGTQTPTATALPTSTETPRPPATRTPVPTSTFTPSPAAASITLAASVSTVVADGTSFTTLTATVRDQRGQPVPDGVQVTFSTNLGTFGGLTVVSVGTVGGLAQVQLSSTATGVGTVGATVNGLVDSINIFFVAGGPGNLALTAAPNSLPANGTSYSVLQATVTDAAGHPVADGTAVNFVTTLGTLSASTASTVGGVASVTLRSDSAGTATVTATAGSASDTTTVTFTPVVLITKIVDRTAAPSGGELVYTIEIVNASAGGSPALLTTLVDVLPAGFTYVSGSASPPAFGPPSIAGTQLTWTASPSPYALAAGGSIIVTFQVRAQALAGTYSNVATINGTPFSSATTGPTAAVTLYNPVPSGISPASACNNANVSVTISGTYFSPGATTRLGPYNLAASWVNETTLTATVPRYIAVGSHDLVVTNSSGASGMLAGAYTALDCSSPNVTLESGYLGTYGRQDPAAAENGDDDQIQVLFIDLPDGSGPFYIRIFDPDCGGSLDRAGSIFNTPFTWTVYGGVGTITNPDARSAHPTSGVTSGTPLATVTFMSDVTVDGQWYNMGPFNANQGELVNGRRVFKLSVVAGPEPPFPGPLTDTDLNLYNVAVSTSDSTNTAPPGTRLFSYSWTFLIPQAEWASPTPIYAYVGSGAAALVQYNFDYDSTGTAGITLVTPLRTLSGGAGEVSGNGVAQSSSYAVQPGETGATWALICWTDPTPSGIADNLVTFWATDQGGTALPLFARPTTLSPPVP